jgi:hypothetical protein
MVEIKPMYVRLAARMASERNASFEQREWNDKADDWGVDPEDRNFAGVMGELAFGEYADLKIDADIYPTSDSGSDFRVRVDSEELTVDVKTRRKEPDRLWVREGRIKADYFVLAYLVTPDDAESLEGWNVELLGAATREELLNATRVESDYGHYNRSIWLEDLHPLPEPDLIEPVDDTSR